MLRSSIFVVTTAALTILVSLQEARSQSIQLTDVVASGITALCTNNGQFIVSSDDVCRHDAGIQPIYSPPTAFVFGTSVNQISINKNGTLTAGTGTHITTIDGASAGVTVGGAFRVSGTSVDFSNNRLQNVATPTAATDAANKAYVDSAVGAGTNGGARTFSGVNVNGGTGIIATNSVTGDISSLGNASGALGGLYVTKLATTLSSVVTSGGIGTSDSATGSFVNLNPNGSAKFRDAAGNFTNISGSGITTDGSLTVGGVSTLGVTTTAGLTNTGLATTDTLAVKSMSTFAGLATFNGGIQNNGVVNSTGNITSDLTVQGKTLTDGAGTVITNGDVTTKTVHSTTITNTGTTKTKDLVVDDTSTFNGAAQFNGSVNVKAGQQIDMGNNIVHGVAGPVVGTDAANKDYVDGAVGDAIAQGKQGTAIAIAMGGLTLPTGKNFALGGNLSTFGGTQAYGFNAAARVSEIVSLQGAVGGGFGGGDVGGRVGFVAAF